MLQLQTLKKLDASNVQDELKILGDYNAKGNKAELNIIGRFGVGIRNKVRTTHKSLWSQQIVYCKYMFQATDENHTEMTSYISRRSKNIGRKAAHK